MMAEKGISKNRTCAEKEELMEDPLIAIDAFMGILMSVNETVNELLLNAHELQRLKSKAIWRCREAFQRENVSLY